MVTVVVRCDDLELLNRLEAWTRSAGYDPVLVTSMVALHRYLGRAGTTGHWPMAIVCSLPPAEQAAEILNWGWLDNLRRSAGRVPVLLLAEHPSLQHSPRPGSVLLADYSLDEAGLHECLARLARWPAAPRSTS